MSKTRLYVKCPTRRRHYLTKKSALKYSNGAYIENVAGAPEMAQIALPVPTGRTV